MRPVPPVGVAVFSAGGELAIECAWFRSSEDALDSRCHCSCFCQVLLRGEAFSGKTALMAHAAVNSDFPFIRKIAADELIGMGEASAADKSDGVVI